MSGKDLQLYKQAVEGDIQAFEELFSSNYTHIYNLCYRMMRNSQDAEDMLQETMLKAWRKLKSFKQSSSFSTWLHRIAANTCLDAIRQRKNNKTSLEEMNEYGKELTDEDSVSFDERSVQRQVIEEALASLKERDRIIIILRDVQGYSYEEMSQILECPMGTVRSRLSRARQSMVKILNEMELKNSYMRQNR